MLTLKTSDFRPAFKNQVNFDHPHDQISFIPILKSSQIRSPTLKSSQFGPPTQNEVNFRAHPKNTVILGQHTSNMSVSTTHTTKLISFLHQIMSSWIPQTEIKSISTTTTRTKSISTLTLETSYFRPARKNMVNFVPRTKSRYFRSSP